MLEKCIVMGCKNHKHEGKFIGDLCSPCFQMLSTGNIIPSEAWFSKKIIAQSDAINATYKKISAACFFLHEAKQI